MLASNFDEVWTAEMVQQSIAEIAKRGQERFCYRSDSLSQISERAVCRISTVLIAFAIRGVREIRAIIFPEVYHAIR